MDNLNKAQVKLIKIARSTLKQQSSRMDKHDYYFGVRFYSDKLVLKKMNDGKSIMGALKELAIEDYESL